MRAFNARFKLPRKRWIVAVAAVAVFAIAVPVAWATFNDVPQSDPFYNDINAIQGAGITSGCGGGNFCPSDSITREAEAAFTHRAGVRAAYLQGDDVAVDPAGTDMGSLTVDVGGVSGGTQFVVLNAMVNTYIQDTTGCPCDTGYYISDASFHPVSLLGYNNNDNVGSDIGNGAYGDDTGDVNAVVAVPTGTSSTFHVVAFAEAGTGTVRGVTQMTATSAPFGHGGGNTLSPQAKAKIARAIPNLSNLK